MIAIAAMTPSRVIGQGNTIPWRIPGEQKWFKEVTMGHPILMGSRTFESIGRPLPGRQNLVVSRSRSWPGVEVIRDLAQFDPERYSAEVYVIGGAEIYGELLDRCRELLITRLKTEYEGDAYFPEFESKFRLIEQIRETPDYVIQRWRLGVSGWPLGGLQFEALAERFRDAGAEPA
jgi:dihydrofolate reductase